MTELKTKRNDGDVRAYLDAVENDRRREDSLALLDVMGEITGEMAEMWGGSIVGYGSYHYVYESGREGDWFLTGFAPRKQSLTLYIMPGFERFDDLLRASASTRLAGPAFTSTNWLMSTWMR